MMLGGRWWTVCGTLVLKGLGLLDVVCDSWSIVVVVLSELDVLAIVYEEESKAGSGKFLYQDY
jgi:hypothetical protein